MFGKIRSRLFLLGILACLFAVSGCRPTPTPEPAVQAQLEVHATLVQRQEDSGPFVKSTDSTDVQPQTRVRTDRSGNADVRVDVATAEGSGASPICFLHTESQAVVLPDGVGGNVLLALETGRILCRNDVDRLNRISVAGAGEIIFTGTAVKVIYRPQETLEVGVATGRAQFQPTQIIALERTAINIEAGEVLFVDLGTGVMRMRPARRDAQDWFDPQDWQVLQRFGIREPPDWWEQDELYPPLPGDDDQRRIPFTGQPSAETG